MVGVNIPRDVPEDIRKSVELCDSIPSFEEIRDVEFVRQSGEINMITDPLVKHCLDRGLVSGAGWVLRCSRNRMFWGSVYERVIESFESVHGPRESWFTGAAGRVTRRAVLRAQRDRLRDELEMIDAEIGEDG